MPIDRSISGVRCVDNIDAVWHSGSKKLEVEVITQSLCLIMGGGMVLQRKFGFVLPEGGKRT